MYIHSLYQIYKDELSSNIKVHEDSQTVLHAFQVRNAELLLKKLSRNGVAMLADSVGLGKTVTAGAVIKNYIEDKSIKSPRIEVIVPASLVSQWESELAKHHNIIVGIDRVHVSSLQNAGELERRKKIDEYRAVDLFVIDEAHNLRNASSERYGDLIEWIQQNEGCHVLLTTATPINNQLSDFATQINLASGGREDMFYVQLPKMGGRQQTIKEHYDAIIDLDHEIKREIRDGKPIDTEKINKVMRPILQHFMVRSTRVGIEREFGGVMGQDGFLHKFPEAKSKSERYTFADDASIFDNADDHGLPLSEMLSKNVESIIDNKQLSKHPLDLINQFANESKTDLSAIHKAFLLTTFLGLPIYRPSLYKNLYYGKEVTSINELLKNASRNEKFDIKQQMTLHNMLRILFLKRAESSVYALKKTMENYKTRLNDFEDVLINKKKIVRVSNMFEFMELTGDTEYTGKSSIKDISEDASEDIYNITQIKIDIAKDKQILSVIIEILEKLVQKDDKLDFFADILAKLNQEGKKALVFSYFSDTIEHLQKHLPTKCDFLTDDNAGYTTDKVKKDVEKLAIRFSPISKGGLPKDQKELQFLFSTDVLSEGQNLQDCDTLINYDLHWNPVRMIQRNGRINRLGGTHDPVYISNLCPAEEIEAYLKLEDRLKKKIELIKSSIGTDQKILEEDYNAIEFNDDQGENQTMVQTKHIYDPGDSSVEDVTREFEQADILATEDVFIADLRRFDDNASPEEKDHVYHHIPLGKWGVLPLSTSLEPTPEVVTHSIISIKENDTIQDMSLFVGLPKTGNTITFVDRLEALKLLQTTKESATPKINFPNINQDKIRDVLDERLIQIAEQAIIRPQNNLKPHQEKVLDLMHELNLPAGIVERALKENRNRSDRGYISIRLSRLNGNIKDGLPMDEKTLEELRIRCERIVKHLDQTADKNITILNNPTIYSYHAKP